MECIFDSKELLEYLLAHTKDVSNTQKLFLYHKANQKNLPADQFSLQIWLNYIQLLPEDEKISIFTVIKSKYYKFSNYWKEFCDIGGSEIANQGIGMMKTRDFPGKNEIVVLLENFLDSLNDPIKVEESGEKVKGFKTHSTDFQKITKICDNLEKSKCSNYENIERMKQMKTPPKTKEDRNKGQNKDSRIISNKKDTFSSRTLHPDKPDLRSLFFESKNRYMQQQKNSKALNQTLDNNNESKNKTYVNEEHKGLFDRTRINLQPLNFGMRNLKRKLESYNHIGNEQNLQDHKNFDLSNKENEHAENIDSVAPIEIPLNINSYEKTMKFNDFLLFKDKKIQIVRKLGAGGSSKVFQVLYDSKIYALKRIYQKKDLYKNEITILKSLQKEEGIIKLIDYSISNELFILLEYGETDLAKVLLKPLNLLQIADFWNQILKIVRLLYEKKIVHSDLKPGNFILVRNRLKLIDFGISRRLPNGTTFFDETAMGTLHYIAPEALCQVKSTSNDIWSIGCILHEMVFGKAPLKDEKHMPVILSKLNSKDEIEIGDINSVIEREAHKISEYLYVNKEYLEARIRNEYVFYSKAIKKCLVKDSKKRVTINELIIADFFKSFESVN